MDCSQYGGGQRKQFFNWLVTYLEEVAAGQSIRQSGSSASVHSAVVWRSRAESMLAAIASLLEIHSLTHDLAGQISTSQYDYQE